MLYIDDQKTIADMAIWTDNEKVGRVVNLSSTQ